jgi:ABC-2 type transport system permease protein
MMLHIIRKEWLEYRQDRKTWWIAGCICLLFAVALVSGMKYYTAATQKSNEAQKASYEQWLSQGKKNPHSAAHYGFYAFKPLSPLAVIDRGMESYLGQAVWLEAHNQNEVKERDATDAGSIVRFGNMSIAFIFIFLLPLGIVLMGFNLFSKEKEYGTFPLLLSNSSSMSSVFAAKAIALYGLVVILLLPMLTLSALGMYCAAEWKEWQQAIPGLLVMSSFFFLYYAVWVLLSLYISSLVNNSSVSLVALLAFWVFGTFFMPRIGSIFSKTLFPAPSSFAFSHAVRLDNEMGIDRRTPAAVRQELFEDSLLKQYKVTTVVDLPLNIRGLNLKRGEEYGYFIFEKNYGALDKIYHRQDEIINWLNLVSPAQSMRSISAGFSGTDINKQQHFAALAEDHRRLIASTMNDDIAENSRGTAIYEVDENLWKKIPPFRYKEQKLASVFIMQLLPAFSLVAWLGLLIFLLKKRAAAIILF